MSVWGFVSCEDGELIIKRFIDSRSLGSMCFTKHIYMQLGLVQVYIPSSIS
jgi:hypothetical protein